MDETWRCRLCDWWENPMNLDHCHNCGHPRLKETLKSHTGILYCVEAWTIPDTEEPCEEEMVSSAEFDFQYEAEKWVMDRMKEGFQIRLYWR